MKSKMLKINKSARSSIITVGMILIAYIICQALIATGNMSNLLQNLLVSMCYYAIMAVSLNLTVGILGQLSLGHAGFMCLGAFAGAIFSKCTISTIENTFIRFTLAILLGAAVAGLFGIFIGTVVLRLRGDYLAIVTLAFGEIIKNVLNVWKWSARAPTPFPSSLYKTSFSSSSSVGTSLTCKGFILLPNPPPQFIH